MFLRTDRLRRTRKVRNDQVFQRPCVVTLHGVANGLLTLAYLAGLFTLLHLARHSSNPKFNAMFLGFVLLALACGAAQVLDVWKPPYASSGSILAFAVMAPIVASVLVIRWARIVLQGPPQDPRPSGVDFAASEVRRADERFHLAIEAAPTGMLMIDRTGRIVLINAQVEKLFGYRRDELLNQPVEMLVTARFRAHHPDLRQFFFAAPQARPMGGGRELYGLRKDGSEVPIEIGLNPLRTSEGDFVLSSIADITERKRATEQFRLAIERPPRGCC